MDYGRAPIRRSLLAPTPGHPPKGTFALRLLDDRPRGYLYLHSYSYMEHSFGKLSAPVKHLKESALIHFAENDNEALVPHLPHLGQSPINRLFCSRNHYLRHLHLRDQPTPRRHLGPAV